MSRLRASAACLLVASIFVTCAPAANAAATLAIKGATAQAPDGSWPTGIATVNANGVSVTVQYGRFSTPSSVAADIAGKFSQTCSAPVVAKASAGTVTFRGKSGSAVYTLGWTSQGPFTGDVVADSLAASTAPQITSVTAWSAVAYSQVIIYGSNFNAAAGNIRLDGEPISPVAWSPGNVTIVIPPDATSGLLVLTTAAGLQTAVPFVVPGATHASCPAN